MPHPKLASCRFYWPLDSVHKKININWHIHIKINICSYIHIVPYTTKFLVHPSMALVLLSASVERCFVSRMRDFSIQRTICIRQSLHSKLFQNPWRGTWVWHTNNIVLHRGYVNNPKLQKIITCLQPAFGTSLEHYIGFMLCCVFVMDPLAWL